MRGVRTDPCGTSFLRHHNLLLLPFPVVRVKLQCQPSPMIMQTMCLSEAIAATCRWGHGAIHCHRVRCAVDKYSSSLLCSQKAILGVLCQQVDLVCGWPPMSKARLLQWEQWVDYWFDMSVDESVKDFKGDAQQRCGMIALCVPRWFFWLRDCNY